MSSTRIKITMLAENTAKGLGVIGEHGLAVWIEMSDHRVLFDTGQGMALPHNARKLGVDLSTADSIVLSHGHFDHVGGLEWMLNEAPEAELWMHPRASEAKFSASQVSNGRARRISIPFMEKRGYMTEGRVVHSTVHPCEVVPGVWVTGEVSRLNDYEDVGGPFFLDAEMAVPDPLLDDQSIFIPTDDGVIVVFGCAHSGVVNTLDHIREHLERVQPDVPFKIRALIGGLHLLQASENRMKKTLERLHDYQPGLLVFCHCTGEQAVCQIQREFPSVSQHGHAGMTLKWS
jgi:7,8-dihydropterin-6-yl-methyl-4-(beta-D-ribofuranosyl)aminobenzene 5'-phosphate synthase